MARKFLFSTFALIVLSIGVGLPTAARAELKFCNQTNERINLAIGYNSPASGKWTSEGWWTIDPDQCKVPLPLNGVLKARYYYYYADSDSNKWSGDYIFCTQDSKFTIEGDRDCKSRGYAPEGFNEIDVGEA